MLPIPKLKYTGALPGGAGNFILLDTTVFAPMKDFLSGVGCHRVYGVVSHDAGAGSSVTCEKSNDRGVTWRLVSTTAAVAGAGPTVFDFVVEGFGDCRITWVNVLAQTYFEPDVSLIDHRPATT